MVVKKLNFKYRICKFCGKIYMPTYKEQICCSQTHQKLLMQAGYIGKVYKQKTYLTCPVCGKQFEKTGNQKYCSVDCRKEVSRIDRENKKMSDLRKRIQD